MSALDELLDNEHAALNGGTLTHPSGSTSRRRRVEEARAELAALREWKATQQSALVAASARLLSTGCAKGPGLLDAIDSVCDELAALRKRFEELERSVEAHAASVRWHRAALDKYGTHLEGCAWHDSRSADGTVCQCGFAGSKGASAQS